MTAADGRALTGIVLRTTPKEAAWTWEEIDGVIERKAFRTPRAGSRVGLRISSWLEDAGELVDLGSWARRAVDSPVAALGA